MGLKVKGLIAGGEGLRLLVFVWFMLMVSGQNSVQYNLGPYVRVVDTVTAPASLQLIFVVF